jgi:acyl-CoA thioester hydrolase
MIRQLGLDYKSMEQQDLTMIAVVEATCRYKSPARYDDELIIRTHISGIRGSILRFTYAIHRADDDLLLCEGSTTHVAVDREMKRVAMPTRYAEAFRAAHVPVTE